MTMYLADSSAWVDYLRHADSPLRPHVRNNTVGHTAPVAMELLSGTTSDDAVREVERLLQRSPHLPFDAAADFPAATELRRRALREGLRVGVVDCMILAVATRHGASLITKDRPQGVLARSLGLRVELLSWKN